MDVVFVRENWNSISTHAPAGGATVIVDLGNNFATFLLTPLREGRPGAAV